MSANDAVWTEFGLIPEPGTRVGAICRSWLEMITSVGLCSATSIVSGAPGGSGEFRPVDMMAANIDDPIDFARLGLGAAAEQQSGKQHRRGRYRQFEAHQAIPRMAPSSARGGIASRRSGMTHGIEPACSQ